MLTLLVVGILIPTFNIQPAKAEGIIYIRADGSIDPPTAPITTVDNVTYVLVGGISTSVIVERDNIVVDGAGHTLNGRGLGGSAMIVDGRSNVTIENMTIKKFGLGISVTYSSNSILSGNNIANNVRGIRLLYSSYSILSGNMMSGNQFSFDIDGNALSHFMHSIDISNFVDGKPVYYFMNQSGIMVNADTYPNVGYLGFVNCTNVTAQGLNLMNNSQGLLLAFTNHSKITSNNVADNCDGIRLIYSSNNTLSGNNIADNWGGIRLSYSSNNTLSSNNITENYFVGIGLEFASYNVLYHNNFVDNYPQAFNLFSGYANFWDDGCEGNYWSDYDGVDSDGDGIGDTPYFIDESNMDNYPLMNLYWNQGDVDHDLDVDLDDALRLLAAYGCKLGEENYNPHCDIAEPYEVINIYDAVLLLINYGKKYSHDHPPLSILHFKFIRLLLAS